MRLHGQGDLVWRSGGSWEVGATREVMTARLREIAIAETRYRRRRPDKLRCATPPWTLEIGLLHDPLRRTGSACCESFKLNGHPAPR